MFLSQNMSGMAQGLVNGEFNETWTYFVFIV